MNKVQELQNEIYRKMPVRKKLEITVSFYRTGKFLNSLKNEQIPRTRKSNQNRKSS